MRRQAYTDTKVITGMVRMSYVTVFTPRAMEEGQKPKYSLCLLIPKEDKGTLQKINAAIETAKKAGVELWGGKLPKDLKMPLRDGDAERAEQPEYVGHYFLNAVSRKKPGIVDGKLKEIVDQTKVYSGCYGKASIYFYAYDQAENKGIGSGLLNLQKVADGEPLTVRSRAEDDFEVVEEDNIFA